MVNIPTNIPSLNKTYIDRFWSRVNIDTPDKCWNWKPKSHFNYGYGAFCIQVEKGKFKQLKAHRVAYFLHYKINPINKCICHSCDNPACCNPNHLFMGTLADNNKDRTNKYRQSCGKKHSYIMKKRIFIPYLKLHPEKAARGKRNGRYTHPEKTARGEKSGNSKLTDEKVIAIRNKFKEGNHSKRTIAKMFNISQSQGIKIINRQSWIHI